MKATHFIFFVMLTGLFATASVYSQEEARKAEAMAQGTVDSPVPFPALAHYAKLWESSIFTTRDLPSPDAPTGPNFADQLSLAGIYEVDGAVVAVLVDRTTSLIMEARIGSENEAGIKIRKVAPGASMEKTRIQLQKGDQAGWVAFSEVAEAPAAAEPLGGISTRAGMPAGAPRPGPPTIAPTQVPSQLLPPPPPSVRGQQAAPDDVPLPPS